MSYEFKTIDDMLNYYYNSYYPMVNRDMGEIRKALSTGTSGVFQTTYGPRAFVQLNQITGVFGTLPKFPSGRKGYRAVTARPSALQGGTAEGGALATASDDTTTTVTVSDKTQQIVYQFSEIMMLRNGKDDVRDVDEIRRNYAAYHVKGIEQSLTTDGNTLAGNNFESLDRVTASTAYATAAGWTTGDEDIYGIDRSANSWADAQVNHNSGTDRSLSLSLMNDILASCLEAGANTNLIITGNDTYGKLANLLTQNQRYTDVAVKVGVNGLEFAQPGEAVKSVLTFNGVPVVPTADVPKDTISRMYFLDTSNPEGAPEPRLGFRMLRPPMAVESTDIIKNGAFAIKGVQSTVGELYCRFLAAQGSLRDLQ